MDKRRLSEESHQFLEPRTLPSYLDRYKKKMNEGSFGKLPVFLCLTCPGPYLFLGQLSGLGKETSYSNPHTGTGPDCVCPVPTFPLWVRSRFCFVPEFGYGRGKKRLTFSPASRAELGRGIRTTRLSSASGRVNRQEEERASPKSHPLSRGA